MKGRTKGWRKGNKIFIHGDFGYILPNKSDEIILIDSACAGMLCIHTWCINKDGYAITRIENKLVRLHHFILPKRIGYEVDHVNGNRLDNRKSNLRYVTRSENLSNGFYNNITGHRYINKNRKGYRVQLTLLGEKFWSPTYPTLDIAVKIRDNMLREMDKEIPYCGLSTIAEE